MTIKPVLLRVGTVIHADGRSERVCDVRLDSTGRVVAITRAPDAGNPSRDGGDDQERFVDRRECTLIPLLADAHVHLAISDGVRESPGFHTPSVVDAQLRTYARAGVGHVLSLGTDQPWVERLCRERQTRRVAGSAVPYTAGCGFGASGGWPPELTSPEPRFRPTDPDAARVQVRALAQRGIRIMKLWQDDFGGTMPRIPLPVVCAIVDEGRRQGMTVCAHVFFLEDARDLVQAGVHVLAHSIRDKPVDERFADEMASRGVKVMPTLVREEAAVEFATEGNRYLNDPLFRVCADDRYEALTAARSTADPEEAAGFRANLDLAMRNLGVLHAAGVEVCLGTDAGFPLKLPGFAEHRELQLMHDAGMPIAAVFAAALANPRRLFARAASNLEPGQPGDFFLVNGDPTRRIADVSRIYEVWQGGEVISAFERT
jgi:imidazolonepropionase-like amidohydrolase